MPKVSVIVPVYGAERYIERCARSLFEQTLEDIEYIFVNDATRDKSIEILTSISHEYPSRRHQINIVNLERIISRERYSRGPARYSEATLVKELEEKGIGRPSTYAPIITVIQNRGYVIKTTKAGLPGS